MTSRHAEASMLLPATRVGRWLLVAAVAAAAAVPWVLPPRHVPQWRWLGRDANRWTVVSYRLEMPGGPHGLGTTAVFDEGRVSADLQTLRHVLAEHDVDGALVERSGDHGIEVWVASEHEAEAARTAVATVPLDVARGDMRFRVEVLPSYPPFISADGSSRTRGAVWTGARGAAGEAFPDTFEGFDAFKAREVARFVAAREKGEKYVPLDAAYRVVPRDRGESAAAPTASDDFAVVEEPASPAERFGGEIFADVRPGVSPNDGPALVLDIKPSERARFRAWTEKNVGLPVALIFNGMYDQAPVINSPLEDSVLITLGASASFDPAAPDARKQLAKRQHALLRRFGPVSASSPRLSYEPVETGTRTVVRTPAGLARARAVVCALLGLGVLGLYALSRWMFGPRRQRAAEAGVTESSGPGLTGP